MTEDQKEPSLEELKASRVLLHIMKAAGADYAHLVVNGPPSFEHKQSIRTALMYMAMTSKEFYSELLTVASLILTRNLDEILGLQDNSDMYDYLGSQLSKILQLFVQDSQHIIKVASCIQFTRLENGELEEHALVATLMQKGDFITDAYQPILRCIENDPILQNEVRELLNSIDHDEPE